MSTNVTKKLRHENLEELGIEEVKLYNKEKVDFHFHWVLGKTNWLSYSQKKITISNTTARSETSWSCRVNNLVSLSQTHTTLRILVPSFTQGGVK